MKKVIIFSLFFLLFSCKKEESKLSTDKFNRADLDYLNKKLLDIAMEDGFNPPVASRVYLYPHLAHYLALQKCYPQKLVAIETVIRNYSPTDIKVSATVNPEYAALLAFCLTAKKVVFSEHLVDALINDLKSRAQAQGLNENQLKSSEDFALSIFKNMESRISQDFYKETRNLQEYKSSKATPYWKETPPDYISGLEPHWPKIVPIAIDTASIFKAKTPPLYNMDKSSEFYKMVLEVYNESIVNDSTKLATAIYWDDNPNTSINKGHMTSIIHKISPPGHWLNIVSIVNEKEKNDIFKATKTYTFTAMAMFDAIISCWYEKYTRNYIRPITVIQEHINVEWQPFIQTPPFPEFTSGHSVASAAAAGILSKIYGDNYNFTDRTQQYLGLPDRSYKSFQEAAWEVSLSRYYGGIHYMISVEEGNRQGYFIADEVWKKLQP
jgi:hypothetical protein